MSPVHEWVFGYGSLVSEVEPVAIGGEPIRPLWVSLRDHRRRWNVAMRNCDPINDRKHYVDPETGERPDVHVAFLNAVSAPGETCDGLAIPVDSAALVAFDEREVNYRRADVSHLIDPPLQGRVWTYVGTEDALERWTMSMSAGRAVIADEYIEFVRSAFERAGDERLAGFGASTDPPGCPLMRLTMRRL